MTKYYHNGDLTRQFQGLILKQGMRKTLARGFTLVELLIVIALLGVIATIVIAAINPIEQANRASDAGMKADASQIVSSLQRYYVTHNMYPWQAESCAATQSAHCSAVDDANGGLSFVSADDPAVGLCGVISGCKTSTTYGELVTSQELQTSFLSKTWVGLSTGSVSDTSKLWVGKADTSSSTPYACWLPKANSDQQKLIASGKAVDVAGGFTGDIPAPATSCSALTGTGTAWEQVPVRSVSLSNPNVLH